MLYISTGCNHERNSAARTQGVFAREQVVEGNCVQAPVMILDLTLKACKTGGNKAIVKPGARFRNKEWSSVGFKQA